MKRMNMSDRRLLTVAAVLIAALIGPVEAGENRSRLGVTTDFAGGAAEVESIDQQARTICVHPADHPNRGWACWWCFKVTGIEPGETIRVQVGGSEFAQPDRATFSLDGRKWEQTSAGQRDERHSVYRQRIDAREAWFAWGPPLTQENAAEVVRVACKNCPDAHAFELCRSRGGRPVPAVRIGRLQNATGPATRVAWIIARQHAWECGSSWVSRGLIEWLVSDDPQAVSLRKAACLHIVPVVDVDNVAIGAGGKEEQPHDHNRDWTDAPYFPAIAALQREISKADTDGRFDLFVDLHNPGPAETETFFFLSPRNMVTDAGWDNCQRFLAAARTEMNGQLAYRGLTRQSGPNYDARWQQIGKNWVTAHTAGHVVSVTLETPWNTPASTSEGYQQLGSELGRTIERFFRDAPTGGISE